MCAIKHFCFPEISVAVFIRNFICYLFSELPWDEPTFSCTEYTAWKDKDCRLFTTTPWTKIDNLALSLLRKVGIKYTSHMPTFEIFLIVCISD